MLPLWTNPGGLERIRDEGGDPNMVREDLERSGGMGIAPIGEEVVLAGVIAVVVWGGVVGRDSNRERECRTT